jgi:hypothetical protein
VKKKRGYGTSARVGCKGVKGAPVARPKKIQVQWEPKKLKLQSRKKTQQKEEG